jgi:uncharacterized protein (TIGR02996 family)
MDEEAFLRAISAATDDVPLRLAFADWLEERGDERAAFIRLQVGLRDLARDDPTREELEVREADLRSRCPPYWLAKLDPPVWCVVGTIAEGPRGGGTLNAPVRYGTRLFRPGAKVFLAKSTLGAALLQPNIYGRSHLVVGQHRKSRAWIKCMVKGTALTNWRVRLIHHPGAIVRLRKVCWGGFRLRPNEFECPSERDSAEAVLALLAAIDAAWQRSVRR